MRTQPSLHRPPKQHLGLQDPQITPSKETCYPIPLPSLSATRLSYPSIFNAQPKASLMHRRMMQRSTPAALDDQQVRRLAPTALLPWTRCPSATPCFTTAAKQSYRKLQVQQHAPGPYKLLHSAIHPPHGCCRGRPRRRSQLLAPLTATHQGCRRRLLAFANPAAATIATAAATIASKLVLPPPAV